MKKINNKFAVLMIFLCFQHQGNTKNFDLPDGFYIEKKRYIKKENSSCQTNLKKFSDETDWTFGWGFCGKETDKEKLETTEDIAKSLKEIIETFNLKKSFEKVEYFSVNFYWRTSHWPLHQKINSLPNWPFGPSKHHSEDKSDKKKRYIVYEQRIRELFLSKEVYGPIVSQLEAFDCKVTLPKYFADPLYDIEFKHMSKSKMVEYKILSENEAKHDFYPYFKGAIAFDVDCKK
ncbi:MAG: hypothetical protein AAGC43_18095 [Bacteroidota bacterium]